MFYALRETQDLSSREGSGIDESGAGLPTLISPDPIWKLWGLDQTPKTFPAQNSVGLSTSGWL